MQGVSERDYAAGVGLSRGAIQKAKAAGRLVLFADGSIDAAASNRMRAAMTDPSKQRGSANAKLRPVPEAALSAVGETLREQGLQAPTSGGNTTFLQARTALTVYQAQERQLAIQKKKGTLVDRARAEALVFRLARQERDVWVTWPARVAALMAAQIAAEVETVTGSPVTIQTAIIQRVLETHVREQLDTLADLRVSLG